MAKDIAERITVDPAVMVGKPVSKGTRVPVELVLAKLAANPDLDELFLDYPELTVEDVKAVLAYASTLVPKREQATARQHGRRGFCVILFRFPLDSTAQQKIRAREALLFSHPALDQFVVLTPRGIRIH